MQTATHHSTAARESATGPVFVPAQRTFPPLDIETRAAVDTDCAAFHLTRQLQTLRAWACRENGPIRPIRINGRLAWPVAELRRLLGIGE